MAMSQRVTMTSGVVGMYATRSALILYVHAAQDELYCGRRQQESRAASNFEI